MVSRGKRTMKCTQCDGTMKRTRKESLRNTKSALVYYFCERVLKKETDDQPEIICGATASVLIRQ